MSRILLIPAFLILVVALAVATVSDRHRQADLTYVNTSGIHTLDPARMSWTTDFRVALNLWEGLTSWDPQTLSPIEAAAHLPPETSADGRTFTFSIREDSRWSNGDPVTAADFVRGWRRGLEPGTSTDYVFLIADHIEGAADYHQWRLQAVAVLTALTRLREGWSISPRQARLLVEGLGPERLGIEPPLRLDVNGDDGAIDWSVIAGTIGRSDVDFDQLHDSQFHAHAAAFDQRFARVGVTADGPHRLLVTLTGPCSYFLDLTGFPVFLPCHESIERLRQRHKGKPLTPEGLVVYDPRWTKPLATSGGYPGLLTNGPYRLADWIFKRRARLVVNPHHRDSAGMSCRTVDMVVYDNVSAALMAYEAGDVDFLPDMSVPYEHELVRLAVSGQRRDFHLAAVLATYFLNFNCQGQDAAGMPNPLHDARLRKALTLAIDREQLVNRVLGRGDKVAATFVPPNVMDNYRSPRGLKMDIAEAGRLLASAGFPRAEGLAALELLYTPNDELLCQAVARMWEQNLGVRVTLRAMESKSLAERKAGHRFMVARGNWFADYRDPTTFLDCLKTGNGNNDSGYSNPRYDELLNQARRVLDPAERGRLLAEAERLIVEEDCPLLPILHYRSPLAIKPHVRGLHPNARLWFPFRYVSVEK